MAHKLKKILCSALSLILMLGVLASSPAQASAEGPYALSILVEGRGTTSVRAYDRVYPGNTYLSMTDLAAALQDTGAMFCFERIITSEKEEYFSVTRGKYPVLPAGTAEYSSRVTENFTPFRNRLQLNGEEKRYYSYNPGNGDLYMSMTDIQLMLDLTLQKMENGLVCNPNQPFTPNIQKLTEDGYFSMVNAAYVGDATSGEIFYANAGDTVLPIASLTKLMTYYVLGEAVEAGEISPGDTVGISAEAEKIASSADGMIKLKAGMQVPFYQLLEGMMVASSNECAVALAEHVSGSEAAFVERMNRRAAELGLSSAVLYNCSGLPSYAGDEVPVKRQNCMSAQDLFHLISLIMNRYPQITEITSQKLVHLPDLLDYWTANTNSLLYNLDGVTGLKTGSTDRAGYCLAVTQNLDVKGQPHLIVLVLLGAESADVRDQASSILLRAYRNMLERS
ncbi:MAG: D-alanyl-D-alanine carboxypeptidase [Oscillospiraceae bacterium]|nr:D-alanyl-D-alanine carboxypeptidase [Oscillospiraceae bacterium]